jgi:hypothetical protein
MDLCNVALHKSMLNKNFWNNRSNAVQTLSASQLKREQRQWRTLERLDNSAMSSDYIEFPSQFLLLPQNTMLYLDVSRVQHCIQ